MRNLLTFKSLKYMSKNRKNGHLGLHDIFLRFQETFSKKKL